MSGPALSTAGLARIIRDSEKRQIAALRVQSAYDFELPSLKYWNYDPCRKHRRWVDLETGTDVFNRPKPGCRYCGIIPRRHQRVGIPWLFLRGCALLADTVGSGKTIHGAGLIALMKELGEISPSGKKVIICARAQAVLQWQRELTRMIPSIISIAGTGTRQERYEKYGSAWEVLVIGPEMLRNDHAIFQRYFDLAGLIIDDVDAVRHWETQTAIVINRLAEFCPRYVVMTGTPLQKRLWELYGVLKPMGAMEIFGPPSAFERRYIRQATVEFWTKDKKGKPKKRRKNEIQGYKNLEEFKERIAPLVLRRTPKDIDDVELPAIIPNDVWLELYPAQRSKYEALRQDVLRIKKSDGSSVAAVRAKLVYGAQICAGLVTLGEPDAPKTSVKMDWLMEQITEGDLSEDKSVVYMTHKATIAAFSERLKKVGVGHEVIWGDDRSQARREAAISRFWDSPQSRVLIGTSAIEQSLNLQVARHLVNVDQIMNPARMEQLAGRIRRDGSAFKTVYVHNLLASETQETRYLPLLEREQALIDFVWDESSELFKSLDPLSLITLITG